MERRRRSPNGGPRSGGWRWRQAYEEWLAERKRIYRPDTTKQSVIACVRLVRLLKIEKGNTSQLEAFLRESMDQALNQAIKELGIDQSLGITGEQPPG